MMKAIKSEKGFTLIEVSIGILVFSIAVVGVMATLGYSLTMSTFAQNRAIAMNKAQQIIEELRRESDTNGLASARTKATAQNWSTFTAQNLDASSNALNTESILVTASNADPSQINVTVNWNEKNRTVSYSVDTMITQR